jgi:3-dehydroquinate dehydratase type II
MSSEVLLLSGPNLNELGVRSPEIYGSLTLGDHVGAFSDILKNAGYSVRHVQSNFEGELIESVQGARGKSVAIVINAGALTHTSWALSDALDSFPGPKIEVHISNPAAREPFRHLSTLAPVVQGSIAGFKSATYVVAAHAILDLLA